MSGSEVRNRDMPCVPNELRKSITVGFLFGAKGSCSYRIMVAPQSGNTELKEQLICCYYKCNVQFEFA